MRNILCIVFLFCSIVLNAATDIVSWNPPAGGLRNTYSDSYSFSAKSGDILSCKCSGTISSGSSVEIYLTINGETKTIYGHSKPNVSFDNVVTYQFEEDGVFRLSYSYTHKGGGTAYKISINAKLNDFVKMTSLSLDTTSLLLDVGNNYTLVPIIIPEYASDKTIKWASTDESVATISSEGIITAIKAGVTTITASSTDGTNYQSSCNVAVRNLSDHHDYIDLGLPSGTLWATTNIGASAPEEQGYNYQWGGLFPNSTNPNLNNYGTIDNLTELEPEDDVATVMWGSNWKIPTKNDFLELIDNCTVSYDYISAATAVQLGSKEYITLKVTAKNGKYILLPQSAILAASSGIDLYYWSSSLADSNCAYSYYFQTSTNHNSINKFERWRSMPIRPICKCVKVNKLSILSSLDINVGDNYQLVASIAPDNVTNPTVLWSTNNESIAKVDQDGKITAFKSGIAEIRAMTTDGSNLSATCRVSVHNPVTSVNLDKNNVTMHVTESMTLLATCLPFDADNTSITWSSSNKSIVTVNNGVITAVGVGGAVITASSINGLSANCNVIVENTCAHSLTINKTSLSLLFGEQEMLTATILPSYTTNKEISWKSNAENIATVSNAGLVKAISTGTVKITATTCDGTNLSASCVVSVTNPLISLILDKTSAELMVGQQITLKASCIPSNADNTEITWSTSDSNIVSVEKGLVYAKKLGTAVITASSANGIEAKCTINVVPTPITSLSLSESSIAIVKDEIFALECTIAPDDATNKELIWHSLNDKIAKVSENGIVTGISTGETTIIVETKSDSKISASCKVKVTTPVISLKLEQETQELYVGDGLQLSAICTPSNADNTRLEWTSSDSNIATVSNNGYVTTKHDGHVRITATTTDGTNLSASCEIIVNKRKQTISWNQDVSYFHNGGEMIALEAISSCGLPIAFTSSDEKVVSIIDLGNVVYANPINSGTAYISAYQEGNYKYESVEVKKKIEVEGTPFTTSKTLVAYYSHSPIIDGIVAELANQITASNISVNLQKIEPVSSRINEANCDNEVRDSILNIIERYPDEANSYPSIKTTNLNVDQYDNIIMVYPLWNSMMAAPMQTFNYMNRNILRKKSVAYIEYELFGDADTASNAKFLRLTISNIDKKSDLIKEWLFSDVTGILQIRKEKDRTPEAIYDLQGRRLSNSKASGIFIINGKIIKNNER